jgi:hypothetical protein
MKKISLLALIFLWSLHSYSQGIAINIDGSSADPNAVLDLKSENKGFLPPRVVLNDADTEAPLNSPLTEGMIIYNEGGIEADGLYIWNGLKWKALQSETTEALKLGDFYQGGIICFVDETGEHGFICSLEDLSTSSQYSNVSTLIGTSAQSDWNGYQNSNAIINQPGHTGSGAQICENYTNNDYGTGIYNDWYLPSIDQLSIIYNNKFIINKAIESDGDPSTGILNKVIYLSSSERNASDCWNFRFAYGYPNNYNKGNSYFVRAVRDF